MECCFIPRNYGSSYSSLSQRHKFCHFFELKFKTPPYSPFAAAPSLLLKYIQRTCSSLLSGSMDFTQWIYGACSVDLYFWTWTPISYSELMRFEARILAADITSFCAPLVLSYYWQWCRAFMSVQVRIGEKGQGQVSQHSRLEWCRKILTFHAGTKTTHINQFTPLFANRPNPAGLNWSHLWMLHIFIFCTVQHLLRWSQGCRWSSSIILRTEVLWSTHFTTPLKGSQQVQNKHWKKHLC